MVAPPYDVVSETERSALAAKSPYNIVRVDLPQGDPEQKYGKAARELRRWVDEGAPVSFSGYGGLTPNGIRIGPVYTPPELRRRGYASALVAELTKRLLDGGRKFCFLFTDLANPTSNSIYQRVGYEPVSDADQWVFGGRGSHPH